MTEEIKSQVDDDEYIQASEDLNMKIWRAVEKTPTSQVKAIQGSKHGAKAIKPHYQRQQATELWGPFGHKWGVRDETFRNVVFDTTTLLKYSAVLYYPMGDDIASFPINATMKEAYVTKGGKGYLMIDDDADKKVSTNALTKGLSFLGFGADVFHGMYDDVKYIKALQEEEGIEATGDAIDEKQRLRSEYGAALSALTLADSMATLEKVYFTALQRFKDNAKWVNEINDVKTRRMDELGKKS